MQIKKAFYETWKIIKRDIENVSKPNRSWNENKWHNDGTYGGNLPLTTKLQGIKQKRKEAFIIVGMENFRNTFMERKKNTLQKEVSQDELNEFETYCNELEKKHPINDEMRIYVKARPYYHRKHRGTRPSQDQEK